MKILIIGGISRSLVYFRGALIQEMIRQEHTVVTCAGEVDSEAVARVRSWGAIFVPIGIRRTGMNPFRDLGLLFRLVSIMKEQQPDVVLGYTIKPNIYGGIAARLSHVSQFFGMVEGLGFVFIGAGFRKKIFRMVISCLYRIGLLQAKKVMFLNPDDSVEFQKRKIVRRDQCTMVNGTGVDLDYWSVTAMPPQISFLMVARLLVDKGVREYANAAKSVIGGNEFVDFKLVGELDDNPASVTKQELKHWEVSERFNYVGYSKDVRSLYGKCSVYVLPSYREGIPRTVLESMAMGRPIITSDAPGCRETVVPFGNLASDRSQKYGDENLNEWGESLVRHSGEHTELYWDEDGWLRVGKLKIGANGILVPVKDVEALAEAMEFFILNPKEIRRMGAESRRYAEERFDVRKVNRAIMGIMGM